MLCNDHSGPRLNKYDQPVTDLSGADDVETSELSDAVLDRLPVLVDLLLVERSGGMYLQQINTLNFTKCNILAEAQILKQQTHPVQ